MSANEIASSHPPTADGPRVSTKLKQMADRLQVWVKVKRQCALTDAHVRMARELGMNPKRLIAAARTAAGQTQAPLAQRIEDLYLRRFRRTAPDWVMPLRQLPRDARTREKA